MIVWGARPLYLVYPPCPNYSRTHFYINFAKLRSTYCEENQRLDLYVEISALDNLSFLFFTFLASVAKLTLNNDGKPIVYFPWKLCYAWNCDIFLQPLPKAYSSHDSSRTDFSRCVCMMCDMPNLCNIRQHILYFVFELDLSFGQTIPNKFIF